MKRLFTILSLVFVLGALALPAIALAGDGNGNGFAPTGWTWDES
jgi:hypothetical protein